MKRVFIQTIYCATAVLAVANGRLLAQDDNPTLPAYFAVRPWSAPDGSNQGRASVFNLPTIPIGTFTYAPANVKGGAAVSVSLIGRNPFLPGKATTTVNIVLVPVIITIGSTVFDSTAVETCGNGAGKGLTDVQLFQGSPLFDSSLTWTMNGVNVGTTTFSDAFRRAEFWSVVGGTNYHIKSSVTVGPTVTITSATVGTNGIVNGSGCGALGIVSNTWFQGYLEGTVLPALSPGVGTTQFPIFVLRNIVQSGDTPPDITNCCIIGYHGAYTGVGGGLQVYSPTEYDTSGRFGSGLQDGSVIAHEVLEAFEDPVGDNPAPGNWGHEGQQSGCQSNYEVGDPLSGTLQSAGGTVGANGVTYHVQELAFFSWFYKAHDGTAPLGAGGNTCAGGTSGCYSSNGTLTGPSQACLPGGTFITN
jgi:hypothetical protein